LNTNNGRIIQLSYRRNEKEWEKGKVLKDK